MSDTPRTDRRVIRQDPRMCGCCYESEITYANFARRLERELTETRKDYECLAQLLDGHDATECRMNLVQIIQQRDGAYSLIEYAGELLGVTPQEHKSAHGFKVLQAIKDVIETNRQLTTLREDQP